MATSGEKEFSPAVREIIDEAYEICGQDPQNLEDQALRSARRSLNQILAEWIGDFTPLWLTQPVTFKAGGDSIPANTQGIAWVEYDDDDRANSGYIQFPAGVEGVQALSIRLDDNPRSYPVPLAAMSAEDFNDYPIRGAGTRAQPYWFWFNRRDKSRAYLVYIPDRIYDFDAILVRSPDVIINSNEEVDIPRRWHGALVWALARKLCIKLNVDANRLQMISAEAQSTYMMAKAGEDDGVSLTVMHGEFT